MNLTGNVTTSITKLTSLASNETVKGDLPILYIISEVFVGVLTIVMNIILLLTLRHMPSFQIRGVDRTILWCISVEGVFYGVCMPILSIMTERGYPRNNTSCYFTCFAINFLSSLTGLPLLFALALLHLLQ